MLPCQMIFYKYVLYIIYMYIQLNNQLWVVSGEQMDLHNFLLQICWHMQQYSYCNNQIFSNLSALIIYWSSSFTIM